MRTRSLLLSCGVAMAVPLMAGDFPRARKPRLELRASPRMAFSPVMVLMTAELRGGEDSEEFYCPALEWDWNDGGKSVHEGDCPPFESGNAMDRRFTAEHAYRRAGVYNIKVTLKRVDRSVAAATTTVRVFSAFGDPGASE